MESVHVGSFHKPLRHGSERQSAERFQGERWSCANPRVWPQRYADSCLDCRSFSATTGALAAKEDRPATKQTAKRSIRAIWDIPGIGVVSRFGKWLYIQDVSFSVRHYIKSARETA